MKLIFGLEQLETATYLSGPSKEKYFRLIYLSSMERISNEKADSIDAVALNQYLDQSGRSDYALASAGARIISTGETQLVNAPNQWSQFFNCRLPENSNSNGPHNVLQPSIHPGECFGFYGRGEIHIKLVKAVFIDAVGIEHILPQMSPDSNIQNAPRQFNVYGVLDSADAANTIGLGSFRYDINKKRPLQLFAVAKNATTQRIDSVRFEFLSNHGAENTCVYRIRVYGSANLIN